MQSIENYHNHTSNNKQTKDKMEIKYSVVVPCYNEDGNVLSLDKEIKHVMNNLISKSKDKEIYEIIYINDGSTDDTLDNLKKLEHVKIINLNRNYGQATALDAGFKASKGELIISLDGDMQNDPSDIPKMLQKLEKENLDVVAGWRKKRKDKTGIKVLTRIGRLFRKLLINDIVHDSGCTLRVYKRAAIKSLDLQGEMHRYILQLLHWKGFRIGEIEVNHRPRQNGTTKYTYIKAVRGLIDLIYVWFIEKYSHRPLHMFGALGIFSFFLGFLAELYALYSRLFIGLSLNRNGWFFLGFFFIITGVILFSFGLAIDLLIKIHLNTSPHESRYYVREIINTY